MLKQFAYRTLSTLRVPELLIQRDRRLLKIVYYHGFTDRNHNPGILNSQGLHLHVDMFRTQLDFLRRHVTVVSLDNALDAMENGTSLPDNPVVITMDDGYRSNYSLAYPLLKEYSMPATIFLATNFVDRREFLWTDRVEYAIDQASLDALTSWAGIPFHGTDEISLRAKLMRETKQRFKSVKQERRESLVTELEQALKTSLSNSESVPREYEPLAWREVEEMLHSGLVSIGSHSSSHFILARCGDDEIRKDIRHARSVIEERAGIDCHLFCYPNGRPGDFDHRTREAVIDAGHRCALTTVGGFNPPDADPFELKRVGTMNGDTRLDFVMTVCGVGGVVGRTGAALRSLRSGLVD